ncbi:MAG: restriction endonuclease subunit S [Smithellaceae bacterium]|nr:restriction endonuclease subunit S [Smithellaceae bacterium]
MIAEWNEITFGQLCTLRAGSAFKIQYQGRPAGDFPFIKVSDMNLAGNEICVRESNHWIDEVVRAEIKAKPFPEGTTVFAKIGEALKQNRVRFLARDTIIDNNMMGAIPNRDVVDARFLYYRLSEFDFAATSTGTALPYLTVSTLAASRFRIPLLPTQRKIATILSAYDDLIENNLRRIKILEEMAQNLYREWFVKFRFPGHQNAHFTNSPLGRIPEAWKVVKIPAAVQVRPKLPVSKHERVAFVPMGSLSETSMLIGDVEYRSNATGARFQNGDTLFARITPCLENGKTGFIQFLPTDDTVACGSTEFIVLRSKTVCPEYVYLMARSDLFRDNAIKSMSGATGRQRVREECFDQFLLAQPPDAILERFQMATRPQFEMIHSLNHRNQTLHRTRDLLLPRLISGEVDVSDLNITIPEETV